MLGVHGELQPLEGELEVKELKIRQDLVGRWGQRRGGEAGKAIPSLSALFMT